MKPIYFDNASTSSPKAPGVAEAIRDFFEAGSYNIARGHYEGAEAEGLKVLNVRRAAARYFSFPSFRHLVFTSNITHSLNTVLKGVLRPGDHALCSAMEHNAVMRPLEQLRQTGVLYDAVPCDRFGRMDPADLEAMIRPETRLVVMTAASNICGTCLPWREVSEICHDRGLFFVLDTAQAAGLLPFSLESFHCDAFCFTGHKGLLGPQGIGGILFSERMAEACVPLISGGTGSFSDSEEVPALLPDRFEAGTLNLPGIIGLGAAIDYLNTEKPLQAYTHELRLTRLFLEGIEEIASSRPVRILGLGSDSCDPGKAERMAVVSLDFPEKDNASLAFALEKEVGVMTRCGLHCAPRAHKTLGTFPQGTVRFSFGRANTEEEVSTVLDGIRRLL